MSLVVSKLIICISNNGASTSVVGALCFCVVIMFMVFLSMCFQPKAEKSLPFQVHLKLSYTKSSEIIVRNESDILFFADIFKNFK